MAPVVVIFAGLAVVLIIVELVNWPFGSGATKTPGYESAKLLGLVRSPSPCQGIRLALVELRRGEITRTPVELVAQWLAARHGTPG